MQHMMGKLVKTAAAVVTEMLRSFMVIETSLRAFVAGVVLMWRETPKLHRALMLGGLGVSLVCVFLPSPWGFCAWVGTAMAWTPTLIERRRQKRLEKWRMGLSLAPSPSPHVLPGVYTHPVPADLSIDEARRLLYWGMTFVEATADLGYRITVNSPYQALANCPMVDPRLLREPASMVAVTRLRENTFRLMVAKQVTWRTGR